MQGGFNHWSALFPFQTIMLQVMRCIIDTYPLIILLSATRYQIARCYATDCSCEMLTDLEAVSRSLSSLLLVILLIPMHRKLVSEYSTLAGTMSAYGQAHGNFNYRMNPCPITGP